jgi:hypothetical protein
MHNLALKGVAKLTHIEIPIAVKTVRHNPLLETEIHIDEELINLKESFDAYHMAGETLHEYPQVRTHVLRERRSIMKHCIGLLSRMIHGKKLTRQYTEQDIDAAVRRLVQLIVIDSRRNGMFIDRDIMDTFRPFLGPVQRVKLRLNANAS